jgi:hypothetical protein
MRVTINVDMSVTADCAITQDTVQDVTGSWQNALDAEAQVFYLGGSNPLTFADMVKVFGDVNAAYIAGQIQDDAIWQIQRG